MNSINQEIHSLAYNCTEKVVNVLRKTVSLFYNYYNFYVCYLTMDKPSKRKPARSSVPSTREKEAMQRELDKKLPKLNRVPVQTEPLKHSTTFMPPVGDLDNAAPPYKEPSNAATDTVVYPDEGYDYRDHYRSYQATRFNSTQVNDEEADTRAEYRYQQHHHPTPAPGYVGAYSAPYSDPNAQGQSLCASHVEPQRES
jgi:hypothetical protein